MRRILILVLATGLFVAGCDAAAERITEEVAERAAEEAGGGNVEIDADSGNVKIESSEGTFEMGGGEIPADFPEEMPVPDYDTVHTSMSQSSDSGGGFMLSIAASGSYDDVVGEIENGLEDGGWEITSRNTQSGDSGNMEMFSVTGNGYEGMVIVAEDGEGVANVQYTLDQQTSE